MGRAERGAPLMAAAAVVAVVAAVALITHAAGDATPPASGSVAGPMSSIVSSPTTPTTPPTSASVGVIGATAAPSVSASVSASVSPSVAAAESAGSGPATAAATPAVTAATIYVRFVNHDPDYPVVFRAGGITVGPLPPWTVTGFFRLDHMHPVSKSVAGHPECAQTGSSTNSEPRGGHWVVAVEPIYGAPGCDGGLMISADDPVGVGLTHPGHWSRNPSTPAPGGAPAPDQPSSTTSTAGS